MNTTLKRLTGAALSAATAAASAHGGESAACRTIAAVASVFRSGTPCVVDKSV